MSVEREGPQRQSRFQEYVEGRQPVLSSPPVPTNGLLNDLISYWKMDEGSGNALDAHGANDLTDTNTVGTATGKIDDARDFESDNSEYFVRADSAALSTGDIDFTFAAWVQLESTSAFGIIGKWNYGTNNKEYLLHFHAATNRLRFLVSPDGTAETVVADTTVIALATWDLVIAWHDAAANTINIQVNDGTPVSGAHAGGVFDGASDFCLGALRAGEGVWDGLIDEVGFWKRVLTEDQRTALYNAGAGLSYDDFEA